MPAQIAHGVPSTERLGSAGYGSELNWEVLRLFLLVGRAKSFRAASEATGQAHNTISRKIAELEKHLGRVLMARSHEGVRLTQEGESLLAEAERMELVLFDILRSLGRSDSDLAGNVSVAIADGLGTHWILPRLIDFQHSFPNIALTFRTSMEIADVMRMEAEVAIQLARPTAQWAILKRLGRLHLMPFASQAYLDLYGTPNTAEDLSRQRIVLHENSNARNAQVPGFEADFQAGKTIVLRTTTSSALYGAIACGLGIGLMPTYMSQLDTQLVPLDVGIRYSLDIWLTCHPDARKIGRIGRTIDWLTAQFDTVEFPWFRDEFIPAGDLLGTPSKRDFSLHRLHAAAATTRTLADE
jgi:DNA-binding transcriptional LysR family regulator